MRHKSPKDQIDNYFKICFEVITNTTQVIEPCCMDRSQITKNIQEVRETNKKEVTVAIFPFLFFFGIKLDSASSHEMIFGIKLDSPSSHEVIFSIKQESSSSH